jgi:hypothetical protein
VTATTTTARAAQHDVDLGWLVQVTVRKEEGDPTTILIPGRTGLDDVDVAVCTVCSQAPKVGIERFELPQATSSRSESIMRIARVASAASRPYRGGWLSGSSPAFSITVLF